MRIRAGSAQPLLAALLFLAFLTGISRDAAATVTIALVWGDCGGPGPPGSCTATGSSTIGADGGQTLRLDIFLSHDLTQGIAAHTFSLNFDTNLDNELNLGPMAQTEWVGTDVDPHPFVFSPYSPFTAGVTTQESSGATAGRINSYESAAFVGVLPANGVAYTVGTSTATAPALYRVGQAYFTVNGVFPLVDGADIFSGAFNGLFDVWVDGDNNVIPSNTIVFGTATVNPATPEPGTVSLLGLGLLGLVLASRRSRF